MTRWTQLVVILICLLLVPSIVSACPVCYGAPNSPMTKSSNNAIMFLLGVVGFVQLGFIALFWSFWRRAKELRRRRESFHVLDGGVAQ
jgi:heme/copper-type cytochrome/quinol oxidase subunit 2